MLVILWHAECGRKCDMTSTNPIVSTRVTWVTVTPLDISAKYGSLEIVLYFGWIVND